jgi:predicted small lipoprotein YifL
MTVLKAFFATLLLATLTACGTGRTLVFNPASGHTHATSARIVKQDATVDVPQSADNQFRSELEKRLYGDGKFSHGSELTVSYRFVSFNRGNRFKRWLTGGIGNSGESSLTVEANFMNPEGLKLGKIWAEGKIGIGFFGGSSSSAIDKAADKVAKYATNNFR